jgi:hypothetical protein
MIEKLIAQSRVTEVNDVATRTSGAFKESGLTDPYLDTTFSSLDAANLKLTLSINRSKAESDLEEKDEIRDDKVRSFYYLVQGASHNPNQQIKEAALVLLNVFDNYGLAMVGQSYATESSLISSLLLDLAKPKFQEPIALLSGCAELIAEIQTAQTNFEQARIAYEAEKALDGMQNNATVVKKEVLGIINDKIVIYLRAMEQVDPATYGVFTGTCAQMIADNNEQVKKRGKKPEAEKLEEQIV